MGPLKNPISCITTVLAFIKLMINACSLRMFQSVSPYLGPTFYHAQSGDSTPLRIKISRFNGGDLVIKVMDRSSYTRHYSLLRLPQKALQFHQVFVVFRHLENYILSVNMQIYISHLNCVRYIFLLSYHFKGQILYVF